MAMPAVVECLLERKHYAWKTVEVVEFSRKHTANVRDGLNEIRLIIENLAACREQRRDSFATVVMKAMGERLGRDADEVVKRLRAEKIPRHLINDAMEIARQQGGYTIFALVDALTKLSQKVCFAGDRAELDAKIGQLLSLAV